MATVIGERNARSALPIAIVVGVLLGLVPLAEPIFGVFRRTVLLNNLFMAILTFVTLVAVIGLVLTRRLAREREPARPRVAVALTALALIEVVFLVFVWMAILATGAYDVGGTPTESGRPVPLIRTE